jgi:putative ABC transport system ATP-binding protein
MRSAACSAVSTKALDDVSLEFAAGGASALMGHTGAGKSTLLQLIGGMDVQDTGEIGVDGRPLPRPGVDARRRRT